MKKGLIMLLTVAIAGMIGFTACQKKEQPAPPPPAEQAPAAEQPPAEGQAPAEQAPAGGEAQQPAGEHK